MIQCPTCKLYGPEGRECAFAPPGPDHAAKAEARALAIEDAYADMQRRGWGFTSNGNGFGDPDATITAIGPYDGVLVTILGADPDPVEAMRKAVEKFEKRKEAPCQ